MKAFFKKFSLQDNLEIFIDTVKRFPLSTICCFIGFIFIVLEIHNHDFIEKETLGRLILSFVLGYFWFGIVQIFAESKGLNAIKHGALAVLGFAPLLLITFGETSEFFRLAFIIPALFLLIMGAPYIGRKSDDESFWVYNRHVWFGVAVAWLASLLLAGGIAAALAAIKYLFDVKIANEIWGDIFAFCGVILGPIYALSFIPKAFDFRGTDCHTPTQVGFIVNWIFAPLVITYMAILYAYFIKIGITWDIPKGQLSFMIVGFIGAGLATYMIAWPIHKTGSKALQLIVKYFFIAMIIPIIFQAISIGMRINQYGFTEQRYVVAMSVFWFGFIAIGFILKKLQLKHIPLSLAVLLLLASVGPWSARDVSEWSQINRLESVLTEHGLFQDGRIIALDKGKELPYEVRKNISGIADYIFGHKHEFYGYDNQYKFFQKLNIQFISKWDRKTNALNIEDGRFNYNFPNNQYNKMIDVSDADYYFPNLNVSKSSRHNDIHSAQQDRDVMAVYEDGNIVVSVKNYGVSKVKFDEILKNIIQDNKNAQMKDNLILKGETSKYKFRLMMRNMSGEIVDEKPQLSYASGDLFIKLK